MSELSFAELGLDPAVLEAVSAVGYETPSPIQAQAIPALLAGNHLLGVAQSVGGPPLPWKTCAVWLSVQSADRTGYLTRLFKVSDGWLLLRLCLQGWSRSLPVAT